MGVSYTEAMKLPRLIIADIDGTLVDDDRKMSKYSADVLNKIHGQGVLFGLASGRPIDELVKLPKVWGLNFEVDVAIGMNGAELYDGIRNKEEFFYRLKKEWIKEIIDLMKDFGLNPYIYYHDKMLCLREDENMHRSQSRNGKEIMVAKDYSDFYKEENAKIMYRVKEKDMPMVEEYVNKHPSKYYRAFKTQTTMLEFADKRVDKAVALKAFCKSNKIDLKDVMAFGDASNDNGMIEIAGVGVALKNAIEETKKKADYVTEFTNNGDGLSRFLEKHFG